MLINNQKIKMRKKGSETTISLNSITDELKDIRTTDVQTPKSHVSLRANPGRAIDLFLIYKFICMLYYNFILK
jgi:hypothetical protein